MVRGDRSDERGGFGADRSGVPDAPDTPDGAPEAWSADDDWLHPDDAAAQGFSTAGASDERTVSSPSGRAARRHRGRHAAPRTRARSSASARRPASPRVVPRSVLGLSAMLLAAGIGAAASGVALFMNYQYRRDRSDALVRSVDARIRVGRASIAADATNARAQIQNELEPLRKLAATGETLGNVLTAAQPSVWSVRTFDVDGAPIIASAFVVASDAKKSFLLTSYAAVQAATADPGPEITIRKGDREVPATLWTWQETRDLALLIVDRGKLPPLSWAPASEVRLGTQVFAVSGLGTAGAAITQGFVADVSRTVIQHTAPTGTSFQGGPVLDDRGRVLAVASRAYAPLGFSSDGVWFTPPIATACERVLKCPAGKVSGAGDAR